MQPGRPLVHQLSLVLGSKAFLERPEGGKEWELR